MSKFFMLDGEFPVEIPENCDFQLRIVNCQSRSKCKYYLDDSESKYSCPLSQIRDSAMILEEA